jgi:hypothetical protein
VSAQFLAVWWTIGYRSYFSRGFDDLFGIGPIVVVIAGGILTLARR